MIEPNNEYLERLKMHFDLMQSSNMRYRQTSSLAYQQAQKGIGKKQSAILGALEILKAASDQDMAKLLNWTINRVTPRRNELVEMGLVEDCGFKKNEFGRRVTLWRIKGKRPALNGTLFQSFEI